jgi:predicted transcriptional regulator
MIAEARAELDAGLYVDAAEVDAWIDSIGTEHELPLPRTRRL